jgi:hypothetical protein
MESTPPQASTLGIANARFYPDRDATAIETLARKVYEQLLKAAGQSAKAASAAEIELKGEVNAVTQSLYVPSG